MWLLNVNYLIFSSQFSCQIKMGRSKQWFPNLVHLKWKSSLVRSSTCEVCISMCSAMPWDLSSSSSVLWSSSLRQASGLFTLTPAWASSWFYWFWRPRSHWCESRHWSYFKLFPRTLKSRKYRIACWIMLKVCWVYMSFMFGSWLGIRLLVSFKVDCDGFQHLLARLTLWWVSTLLAKISDIKFSDM